jgi:hypothetical protein
MALYKPTEGAKREVAWTRDLRHILLGGNLKHDSILDCNGALNTAWPMTLQNSTFS